MGLYPQYELWVVAGLQVIVIILTTLGYYHAIVKPHAERQAWAKANDRQH